MYFQSVAELMAMDGHGVYVWSVYILAVLVLSVLVVVPLQRKRRIADQLRGQIRREFDGGSHSSPDLE